MTDNFKSEFDLYALSMSKKDLKRCIEAYAWHRDLGIDNGDYEYLLDNAKTTAIEDGALTFIQAHIREFAHSCLLALYKYENKIKF